MFYSGFCIVHYFYSCFMNKCRFILRLTARVRCFMIYNIWARRRFNRLFREKHCAFRRRALSIKRLFLSGARLPLPLLVFLLLMPLLPPSDAVRGGKIRRFYEDFFGSFTVLLLGAPSMAETAFLSQFLLFLRVFGLSRGTLAGSPKPFPEEIST